MKRLILGFSMLVLLGLGCNAPIVEPISEVGGQWYVDFDVAGEEFFAMDPYVGSGIEFGTLSEPSIYPGKNRAWIQNVDRPVLVENVIPRGDLEYYEGDDWVLVDVSVYQGPGATIRSDAEIVEVEDKEFGIVDRGDNPSLYYYKTGERLYEMYFYSPEGHNEGWEEVIGNIVENGI